MLTVKFRYKSPDKENSELIVHTVIDKDIDLKNTSDNFRFATSVAGFAMLLRNSDYKGNTTYANIITPSERIGWKGQEGYRKEFLSLIQKAENYKRKQRENNRFLTVIYLLLNKSPLETSGLA